MLVNALLSNEPGEANSWLTMACLLPFNSAMYGARRAHVIGQLSAGDLGLYV